MVDSPLVSIVIPVFNAEKTIYNCINDVLNQTFKNFEIVIINDGSTDNSLQICNDFALRDERIKIFSNMNHGVSYSRNYGIKKSQGRYLVFVDSDDRCPNTMLETLLKFNNGEFVLSNISDYYKNSLHSENDIYAYEGQYLLSEFLEKVFVFNNIKHFTGAIYAKLFDLLIIKNNKIFFDENLNYAEDFLFIVTYLKFAPKIKIIPITTYHYTIYVKNSLTQKNFHNTDVYNFWKQRVYVYKKYEELMSSFCRNYINIEAKTKELFYEFLISSIKMACYTLRYKDALNCIKTIQDEIYNQNIIYRLDNPNWIIKKFKNRNFKTLYISLKIRYLLKKLFVRRP